MAEKATLALRGRNPDVLTCIANLSNDEVFTPPELANQMLDGIAEAWAEANDGDNIWSDKTVTFFDPFTKSGVFLREITKRLIVGLEAQMPNLQRRVDHILTKQVFGVGITQLTALLARRSLYCSKWANGEHSVCDAFTTGGGNIWFEELQHTWVGGRETVETADKFGKPVIKTFDGRCSYCGASQKTLDRAAGRETHAYALIHTDDPHQFLKDAFGEDMQFDVIIGNPPYQLDDGGFGTSAAPIYQKFVEQAKNLDPRFLSMVIPARWFAGGKGLDEFRDSMLNDNRLRVIQDYPDSSEVFPGVQIKGGVCYFLWNREQPGDCSVTTHDKGEVISTATRPLLEPGADVFVRYNEAISILKKVVAIETGGTRDRLSLPVDKQFSRLVSSRKPFGLDTTFRGSTSRRTGDVLIYENGGKGYVARADITKGTGSIDKWKVFIPALGSGSDSFPHPILGNPFVGEPGTVSTETYMCIGPLGSLREAESVISYIQCRLLRFLVLLHKPSQHATQKVYSFVPVQDWSKSWTDEELYAKYGLTDDEIAFIEKMIRPMGGDSE